VVVIPAKPVTHSHGKDAVAMNSFYTMINTMKQRRMLLALLLLTALLSLASAAMAAVQASIDRPVVYDGESFNLVISSDAKWREMPDLTLLEKDFHILGSGSSQQVQMINGVTTVKTSWTITLRAKTSGQLHIPSLRVGKELTNPIQVTVTAPPEASSAKEGQHIFIEAEIAVSDKPVYLQQQILYTVRLVFDQPIMDGSLSDPAPENALVEQLGKNNRYTSQRNGKPYNVIERRYAIFAEKSGELVIPPLRFTGSLRSDPAGRRRPSRIDPNLQRFFGGDPFAGAFDRGRPVSVQGKSLSINVLPRPASFTASNWLPSAELVLKDSWLEQPPEFKVGIPVSRSITIQAKGLLATLLPALKLDELNGANVYPEQPVSETRTDGTWVYGVSKQSLSYMPTKTGLLLIPELKLTWWDTGAGVERSAVLPKWSVEVLPGKDLPLEADVSADDATMAEPDSQSSEAETETAGNDWQVADWLSKTLKEFWLLLLIIAGVIFILYRRQSKTAEHKTGYAPDLTDSEEDSTANKLSQRALQKRLSAACSKNDAATAADILLKIAAGVITENPPKTLPALAGLLEHGSEEIYSLDRYLYAGGEVPWDGVGFYEYFKGGLVFRVSEKNIQEGLAPLYPE
jgi:hypothetical protein